MHPKVFIRRSVQTLVNSYAWLFLLSLIISKFVLHYKLGDTDAYRTVGDTFFPSWLGYVDPIALDLPVIVLIVLRGRVFHLAALVLCFIQVIHPQSFGIQNYVIMFWMLCWWVLKDERYSMFLGRVVVSFIFLGAFLGKLTPGWIDSTHLDNLHHIGEGFLRQGPLFLAAEGFVAISFLLPLVPAALVNISIFLGMFMSINFFVFDGVGPVLAVMIMFLSLHSAKRTKLQVYFDADCGICMKVRAVVGYLGMQHVQPEMLYWTTSHQLIDLEKAHTYIASVDGDGNVFYGYDTYCEMVRRAPFIAFLYPLLRTRPVTYVGERIYHRIASSRACAI